MVGWFRLARCLVVLTVVEAISACGSSPSGPSPALTGLWGGNDILLTVADTGSHLEFDCAQGEIPGALTVNNRSEFNVRGTFVREHGGPIPVDGPGDSHPAVYFGSVAATTMILTVRLTDTGEVIGPFSLTRGAGGRVLRCVLPLAVAGTP